MVELFIFHIIKISEYEITEANNMIKATYSPNGGVVPDAHVHRWGEELLQKARIKEQEFVKKRDEGTLITGNESPDIEIMVGAEIMILLLVSYLYNGRVHPSYIDFFMEGKKEPLKKAERRNGKITVNFEPGFCDVYDKICNTIVGA